MHKKPIHAQTIRPLWTREDVSGRWKKSIETLKRLEKKRILIPLKLGRSIRYRPEDIERIEAEAEVH